MNVIQLGPLMLNFELLTFIFSAVMGYLALRYRLNKMTVAEDVSVKFLNALILGFFTWKFSLIIFDPLSVIQHPMSLLYFSGGEKGLWLAIAFSIIYIWIRTRKDGTTIVMNLDGLGLGWLVGSSVYYLLQFIVDSNNLLFLTLLLFINIVLTLLFYTTLMRKNWITIMVVLTLVFWGAYDYIKDRSDQQMTDGVGIKVGNKAPDFELVDLGEQPMKLSDFTGKKVILNFWATWCPPCKAEMPHMEKFYMDYEKEVVVLSVNLTHTESKRSNVKAFVEEYGLHFPVVMDLDGEVSRTYNIYAYPTSYMIDSNGIIQEIFQGAINYDTMVKSISRIQ